VESVTATCPFGKRVIGGGADIDQTGSDRVLIHSSAPSVGGTSWVVEYFNPHFIGQSVTIYAIAICAFV